MQTQAMARGASTGAITSWKGSPSSETIDDASPFSSALPTSDGNGNGLPIRLRGSVSAVTVPSSAIRNAASALMRLP